MSEDITTNDLLLAYRAGLFPMAESREDDQLWWFDPPERGQLDINNLHISSRLRRTVHAAPYTIKIDTAFDQVIEHCAAVRPQQYETWINPRIRTLFGALHREGWAHSIEAWEGDKLVGGLYGLALGGLFCGESMFSKARDSSKICLVHLCARLWKGGFSVLDTQFVNPHLMQFGCYEVSREEYHRRLQIALPRKADFSLSAFPALTETALVSDYLKNR